jgi:hypothetical protein
MAWEADPTIVKDDIQAWESKVAGLRKELKSLDDEEDVWLHCFEQCRMRMLGSIGACRQQAEMFATHTKKMMAVGVSYGSVSDDANIFRVWERARIELEDAIKDYESALKSTTSSNSAPIDVSVSAADFKVLSSLAGRKENSAARPAKEPVPAVNSESKESQEITTRSKRHLKDEEVAEATTIDALEAFYNRIASKQSYKDALTMVESTVHFLDDAEDDNFFAAKTAVTTGSSSSSSNAVPDKKSKPSAGVANDSESLYQSLQGNSTVEHWEAALNTHWMSAEASRRKKKFNQLFATRSFPLSRTPHGVELKITPLSQYEDRYLAPMAQYRRNCSEAFVKEESDLLRCTALLGQAAYYDSMFAKYAKYDEDWKDQLSNVQQSVEEAKTLYKQVLCPPPENARAIQKAGTNLLLDAAAVEDSIASLLMMSNSPRPAANDSSNLDALLSGIDQISRGGKSGNSSSAIGEQNSAANAKRARTRHEHDVNAKEAASVASSNGAASRNRPRRR